MLKTNLKSAREAKGLSQEQLAAKLHVVRQTVSKWERGSSIPDARMLLKISEALETPAYRLLDETIPEPSTDDNLPTITQKLEAVHQQLLLSQERKRKLIRGALLTICLAIIIIFIIIYFLNSPYLGWSFDDPETAVLGTAFHSFEWLFVRIAPIVFLL